MVKLPGSPEGRSTAVQEAIEVERVRRAALKALDAEDARRAPSMAAGVARSVAQGATFGFADEIEAGARAAFGVARHAFGFDNEADAAIRSLWARGDGPGFASAARGHRP